MYSKSMPTFKMFNIWLLGSLGWEDMKVFKLKQKVPVTAAHAHALNTGTTSLILLEWLSPSPSCVCSQVCCWAGCWFSRMNHESSAEKIMIIWLWRLYFCTLMWPSSTLTLNNKANKADNPWDQKTHSITQCDNFILRHSSRRHRPDTSAASG